MNQPGESTASSVVGIFPAAGRATRLGRLPCSKEILPIGVRRSGGEQRITVLGDYLLEDFARAGIEQAYLIISPAKTDVARYFAGGERYGLRLSYVTIESPGTVFSVDAAYPFVRGKLCALGFPDILHPRCDPYSQLIAALAQTGADIVLGLFPTDHPSMVDMVRCDSSGRVESILVKPKAVPAGYDAAWFTAVWRPRFSDFLHDKLGQLEQARQRGGTAVATELYLSDVILAALEHGMVAQGLLVSKDIPIDAGTPDTYALALARFGALMEQPSG